MTPTSPLLRSALARLLVPVSLLALLASCSQPAQVLTPSGPKTYPAPTLVQVENAPGAHPHSGLQEADIVYEYLTEGGISRFTVIYFHPHGSFRVEPVRSTRLVTITLQKAYQGLVFTSGASDHVLGILYRQSIPFVMESTAGGRYFNRDPNRGDASEGIAQNLYTTGDQMADGIQRRHMRITYQLPSAGNPSGGTPATHISFNQTSDHQVRYVYSTSAQAYEYFWGYSGWQGGPEIDTDNGNQPVMVKTVVIVNAAHHGMHYHEDYLGEEGIDFTFAGQKLPATIFTLGTRLSALFDFSQPNAPPKLEDLKGHPLKVPAGLMWVHLVDPATPLHVT